MTGVLLNAAAQLALKAGTNSLGVLSASSVKGVMSLVVTVALSPFILLGLLCYVLSVGIWIVALSRVDVSVAYPMLSIGYVVNAIAAAMLFGEAIGALRVAGIAVILIGVFLIARSA